MTTNHSALANPHPLIGQRIVKMREGLGWKRTELAKATGLHRNTLDNYEQGKTDPGAMDLLRIARALGCAVTDLLRDDGQGGAIRFAFRAHALLKRDIPLMSRASQLVRAYHEIEQITGAELPATMRKFPVPEGGHTLQSIRTMADMFRKQSDWADTSPANIAGILEGLGVRVVFLASDVCGLEGLSAIHGDKPFVLLRDRSREKKLVERTIFSAAHELGHLVLHPWLFQDAPPATQEDDAAQGAKGRLWEKEANTFAGHFLVPADELHQIWFGEKLGGLPLFDALLILKRVFPVSFHCLHHRVKEDNLRRPAVSVPVFLNQIKTRLGIHGKARMEDLEPAPLPPAFLNTTNRFSRLVYRAFVREEIGVGKVAELFQVPLEDAKKITARWMRPAVEELEQENGPAQDQADWLEDPVSGIQPWKGGTGPCLIHAP